MGETVAVNAVGNLPTVSVAVLALFVVQPGADAVITYAVLSVRAVAVILVVPAVEVLLTIILVPPVQA